MAPPQVVEEVVEQVVAPPQVVEKVVEQVVAPPPPSVEEVVPDSLVAIRGIGFSTQERLNEGGFLTYAQLAEAKVEEIEELLGPTARLADVESWIEQAKELRR